MNDKFRTINSATLLEVNLIMTESDEEQQDREFWVFDTYEDAVCYGFKLTIREIERNNHKVGDAK